MRFRVPAFESASALGCKVFISYRATEGVAASQLRLHLRDAGFDVLMIEPSRYELYRTNVELLMALRNKVQEADAVCVVVSEAIERSEYVQAEINEALRLLGRAIFVHECKTKLPSKFEFRDPGPGSYGVGFVVKHTLIGLHAWNESSQSSLVTEILNDPDEGWFADRRDIPSWWLNRDFHAEASLRKYARMSFHVDRHTSGYTIYDVMPLMASWDYPKHPREMFDWYSHAFGRPDLLKRVSDGECDAMVARLPVATKGIVEHTSEGWLWTLYLRSKTKESNMNVEHSVGRYPVPSEQCCQWPDCESPANGSFGSNGDRMWLCLKHLKQVEQIASELKSEGNEH